MNKQKTRERSKRHKEQQEPHKKSQSQENLIFGQYGNFSDYLLQGTQQLPKGDIESDQTFLQPFQQLVKQTIHPNSEKYRFLLKHSTGSGKTLSALLATQNFVQKKKNVFIITFNRQIFYDDLIKFPGLGFVTNEESAQIYKQDVQISNLEETEQGDVTSLRMQIVKRINQEVRFFGYKEFYNQMFKPELNVQLLKDLDNALLICDEIHNVYNRENQNTYGQAIYFVSMMFKSRIHALYMSATPINNPQEINDLCSLMQYEGVYDGIQQIVQKYNVWIESNKDKENQVALFLRQNYPIQQIMNINKNKEYIYDSQILQDTIETAFKDKISYIPEITFDVPKVEFQGDQYASIQNVRFVICNNSNQEITTKVEKHHLIERLKNKTKRIQISPKSSVKQTPIQSGTTDETQIQIVGNPQINKVVQQDVVIKKEDIEKEGIEIIEREDEKEDIEIIEREDWRRHHLFEISYRRMDLFVNAFKRGEKQALQEANLNKITIRTEQDEDLIEGDFALPQYLEKYSPKLHYLLIQLLSTTSKSFVYVNTIKYTGLRMIEYVLKRNGIIPFNQSPTQHTICFVCKQSQKDHLGTNHTFLPYRFVSVTGRTPNNQALSRFNDPKNSQGQFVQIVIGSIKMTEGYNLFAVNNVYIVTFPYNVPRFIQVIGRAIRTKSHIYLDDDKKFVNIHILVLGTKEHQNVDNAQFLNQYLNQKTAAKDDQNNLTRDEIMIWNKFNEYNIIQMIEQILHKYALDLKFYPSLYFSLEQQDTNGILYISQNKLKSLPFVSDKPMDFINQDQPLSLFNFDLSTFYSLNQRLDLESNIQKIVLDIVQRAKVIEQEECWQQIRNSHYIGIPNTIPNELLLHIASSIGQVLIIPKYLVYSANGELDAFCYKETDEDRNVFIHFDLSNINTPQDIIDKQELIINEIFQENMDYVKQLLENRQISRRVDLQIDKCTQIFDLYIQMSVYRNKSEHLYILQQAVLYLQQNLDQVRFKCDKHQQIQTNCKICVEDIKRILNQKQQLKELILHSLLFNFTSDQDFKTVQIKLDTDNYLYESGQWKPIYQQKEDKGLYFQVQGSKLRIIKGDKKINCKSLSSETITEIYKQIMEFAIKNNIPQPDKNKLTKLTICNHLRQLLVTIVLNSNIRRQSAIIQNNIRIDLLLFT